jgi:murein L,D-transpeptidase YcbB/YkuD
MLKTRVPVLLFALCGSAPAGAAQQPPALPDPDPVREAVRTRLEAPDVLVAAGQILHATTALPMFYERRAYTPVWVQDGAPTPAARRLVREIARSDAEGLRPGDYHLEAVRRLIREAEAGAGAGTVAADLELLLSDAFLVLGSHYLSGRVDPATIHTEWVANRRNTDMTVVLDGAVASGEPGLALQALLPAQPGYARLREALTRYRTIDARGGWPTIEPGATLRFGDEGPRVGQLQARLVASGDMASDVGSAGIFGAATEAAVREVQRRHGLDTDGVVGAGTLAALNDPVQTRIRQVVLNMERWRWLPQELGSRYILVNIANFELDVVEAGREVMTMRVAVGRPFRKTPVFSDRMTHLVLSPYWHVPTNLAVQDKLPEINRLGTEWFARNNMRVFQGWGSAQQAVDPAAVDWSRLGAGNFPYHLRQDPGPSNALGRVKFMFPNRFNVYLHDTPGREIFARTERAFSSGCIRIEKPLELALYLIGGQGWTRETIQAVVDARVERTVNLVEPVPVHLLYWTAWADPQGTLNFRRDIYDRDAPLAAALAEQAPRPGR